METGEHGMTMEIRPRQALALQLVRAFAAGHGGRLPTSTELGRLFDPPIRPQSADHLMIGLRLAGIVEINGHGPQITRAGEECDRLRQLLRDARSGVDFPRMVDLLVDVQRFLTDPGKLTGPAWWQRRGKLLARIGAVLG